jgi:GNAT superfamily N-acetyltransferase
MCLRIPCSDGEPVRLRDGGFVLIRPLLQSDRPSVVSLFAGLSPESRAQRFHSSSLRITPAVIDLVTAGHVLVATRDEAVVALASWHPRHDPALAEVAIVVADAEQRRGIGTALTQRLVWDACSAGIRRLRVEVGSNRGVFTLLRTLGVSTTRQARRLGLTTLEFNACAGSPTLPEVTSHDYCRPAGSLGDALALDQPHCID